MKNKKIPIYVSLTSIFKNQSILLETLKTLKNQSLQPDKIFLYLSEEPYILDDGFKNKKITNSDLQMFIKNNEIFNVKWVKNIGSYRKLLPLLKEKWEEDCIIITVDDDACYDFHLIENLVNDYNKYNCAIGYCGYFPDFTKIENFDYKKMIPTKKNKKIWFKRKNMSILRRKSEDNIWFEFENKKGDFFYYKKKAKHFQWEPPHDPSFNLIQFNDINDASSNSIEFNDINDASSNSIEFNDINDASSNSIEFNDINDASSNSIESNNKEYEKVESDKEINNISKINHEFKNVSLYNFNVGVGGILYKPSFFYKTKNLIFNDKIYSLCDKQDDIWFYLIRILNNINCYLESKKWRTEKTHSNSLKGLYYHFNRKNNSNTVAFKKALKKLKDIGYTF